MSRRRFWVCQVGLGVVVAACIVVALKVAHYQFGAYDPSSAIDIGWRLFNHQVPGRDFICTFPPALYLAVLAGYRLFGVTWMSLIQIACVIFAVVCLLGLRVVQGLGRVVGEANMIAIAAVYVCAQAVPLLVVNHVWHSALAQSFAVYALLTTFVLIKGAAAEGGLTGGKRTELYAHLTIAFAALILCKPNTGYPAIAVCVASLLVAGVARRVVVVMLGVAVVVSSLLLLTVHQNLLGMLAGYWGLNGRLIPKPLVIHFLYGFSFAGGTEALLAYTIPASALVLAVTLLWQRRREIARQPLSVLAAGSMLVSLIGLATDFELRIVDMPALMLGLILLAFTEARPQRVLRSRALAAAVMFLLLALFYSKVRARMLLVGMWAGDQYGYREPFNDRFFGVLHAPVVFHAMLTETDAVVAAHPGAKVFFGPRLEFEYAREGIASPLHLPVWWDPGTSYPLRKESAVDAAWTADRFDVLIFYRDRNEDGKVQLSPRLSQLVQAGYRQAPSGEDIEVYLLNGSR